MANVIRDPYAMEKFSMAIEHYDEEISKQCSIMEAALNEAENSLRDDNTKNACAILYDLISEIKDATNPLSGYGDQLSKGAKVLRRAEDVMR